ncbi:aldo/keto reductase [Beutenbergia cavernae DSM 12333]|uniref:Aldo/keto reductase n=1 Tax=Beutenbergia cavernae (strain ATCC BAA-8 / DSM 12333 / CCUG 43141 / JCM 11478 / NBRC 16432 / NCIMB 13614 / HKI 0122) TaxID=471853 RepID=C5BUT7_BEUC1|nr:aldo/keto reductase [Beutenbergia cavernae]ACQ78311.1 aldo/keto reductase [Beutenbergia cavernae DSM 12333]
MRELTLTSGDTHLSVSALCLGTMLMGTQTDAETSFAILDRYYEAGGRFLDTANNYNHWGDGHGRDSEELLGRWLAARGTAGEMVVATKAGAAKKDPALPLSTTPPTNYQGLEASIVRREAEQSLRTLGVERLDVYYGHVDDRDLGVEEIAQTFGELAKAGTIGVPGLSNTTTWRFAEARAAAARVGLPEFGAIQQESTYLQPRPGSRAANYVNGELLDYADSHPDVTILAYAPQSQGVYANPAKSLRPELDHPATPSRWAVLRDVAEELGATQNQVVLAWLLGGDVPQLPVFGASSVAQLDEALGALTLEIPAELRARLDAA